MPDDDTRDEDRERKPLLRRMNGDGEELRFPPANVTFEGVLPPHFDGPVGGHLQGIFRPVSLQLEPGNYLISIHGQYVHAGDGASRRSVINPVAMCIGSFVAVWLKNATSEPQPFKVQLLGHNGDRDAPDFAELCSAMNFGLKAARYLAGAVVEASPE